MLTRRRFAGAAGSAALAAAALPAAAQADYPVRAISYVVPYPPGGVNDAVSRGIAQKMSEMFGQPVVIDNRAGAGTSVASAYVATQKPDGYVIYGGGSSLAINPTLKTGETYVPKRDFAPVSLTSRTAFVLHVTADLPVANLKELLAWLKANPNRANFASSGVGAVNHLSGELLKKMSGVEINHVPYRGGVPAAQDVAGGQVPMMFSAVLEALPLLQGKRTRAIAVSSKTRVAVLPDVPSVHEAGLAGFDTVFWQGLFVPTGTPAPVIAKLNGAVRRAASDPDMVKRFADQGTELASSTPEELAALLDRDSQVWGTLIRELGLKAE